MVKCKDGGYIIVGTALINGGGTKIYLIKLNINGNLQWTKKYGQGGNTQTQGAWVEQILGGGYIITGFASYVNFATINQYMLKVDSVGNPVWAKTYDIGLNEEGVVVHQTTDSGFITAGNASNGFGGINAVYIIKTNQIGDTLWTKVLSGKKFDKVACLKQSSDGGFILAGGYNNLVKTDSMGFVLWSKTYGDDYNPWGNDNNKAVDVLTNGGYIAVGKTVNFGVSQNGNVFLIKIDSLGNSSCHVKDYTQNYLSYVTHVINETVNTGTGGILTTANLSLGNGFNICNVCNINAFFVGLPDTFCTNSPSIVLNAAPPGGLFSGQWVSGNSLLTSVPEGMQYVTYVYTDTNSGCFIKTTDSLYANHCTVGLGNRKKDTLITVFPNPSNGEFEINSTMNVNELRIRVINLLGKIFFDEISTFNSNKKICLKELPSGIYFLQLVDKEKLYSKKVIIQQ